MSSSADEVYARVLYQDGSELKFPLKRDGDRFELKINKRNAQNSETRLVAVYNGVLKKLEIPGSARCMFPGCQCTDASVTTWISARDLLGSET